MGDLVKRAREKGCFMVACFVRFGYMRRRCGDVYFVVRIGLVKTGVVRVKQRSVILYSTSPTRLMVDERFSTTAVQKKSKPSFL